MSKSERRANGDGSFTTRENGTIQYRVAVGRDENGKTIRLPFYGKTQADCRRQYKEYLKSQEADSVSISPNTTLKIWIDKYLEAYRNGPMKKTSYHQLELLRDRIDPMLMSKKVREIQPIELQKFMTKFANESSKSYITKMLALLRDTFAEAQENGICSKNPARKLKAPPKQEKARENYTRSEATTIIQFALSYSKDTKSDRLNRAATLIATAVITLTLTGMRRGELLGLMYTDIDKSEGVIHIRRAVYLDDGKPQVEDGIAKTYSSIGDIPAPDFLLDLLLAVPKRGLYVFSAYTGGLMNPRNFNRSYDSFFKNLNKEHPEVRALSPHCCRHTCATLMQASGDNIKDAKDMLRHSNIKTTQRYSHPDMDRLKQAAGAYADYVCDVKKD